MEETMANTSTPAPRPNRPVMDEWGVYDPQQAGLTALFARLDQRGDALKGRDESAAKARDLAITPDKPKGRSAT
jgi:hypothetical protein